MQQKQQLQQQQHLCLNLKNLALNKNLVLALPLRRIPFTETNRNRQLSDVSALSHRLVDGLMGGKFLAEIVFLG